ncbi:cold adaptation protein AtcA [Shewanella sp. HL-SH2]|uniref:cold adaptation protein AtcA n=1 Tax=Shewanella sp. HL-SH2 TaxID=3436238 RepID=UPI003EB92BEC
MAKSLNIARIHELKNNAYDNIESYNDPDTPKALENFSRQIKEILLADISMLSSVPEYLPVALFGQVKFAPDALLKWAHWIDNAIQPEWDEFKVSIAFNNGDIPLVQAVRAQGEALLIESCAVLYLLNQEANGSKKKAKPAHEDDDEEYGQSNSDYDDDDNDSDEEGYYDQYDDEDR